MKRSSVMTEEKIRTEEYKVTGDELVAKVKHLMHEGNIRKIIIKRESGDTLLEFPLTVGVVGAVLLPMWAALGAAAALITDCTIAVEKVEESGT
jgi:CBS domain-containing protein